MGSNLKFFDIFGTLTPTKNPTNPTKSPTKNPTKNPTKSPSKLKSEPKPNDSSSLLTAYISTGAFLPYLLVVGACLIVWEVDQKLSSIKIISKWKFRENIL